MSFPVNLLAMHGVGNAFALLDAFGDRVPHDLPRLARGVCGGFGLDGLLVIERHAVHAAAMRVFNADGSEAEMCGNGLRCVGKLLVDADHVAGRAFVVATAAGPREVEVLRLGGETAVVQVSLGVPMLDATAIPTTLPGAPPLEVPLNLHGERAASAPFPPPVRVTCLALGNPHAVAFADAWSDAEVARLGPAVERHPAFPNRVNAGFAVAESRGRLALRVWERGVGETAACGTGAAAAVVAGVLTGRCRRRTAVRLRGGTLEVAWPADATAVTLVGAATTGRRLTWPARRAA